MRARFTRLIRRTLSWPAHRLDAQDARAYNRGWTVTSGKFGSRTYRDPRWDHVEELRAEHLRDEAATGSRPDLAPAQRDARAVLR
ncbi:hypothetical protein TOK_1026 [Pseudonocardia sp. N23]|nr:hypothetical protein TOK_1026 [Pseudonocardia sp. N23]